MKKLNLLGLSLITLSSLSLNSTPAQAVALQPDDFFQITVEPSALGTIDATYTLDGGALQNTVITADKDLFISEFLLPVGTLEFALERPTQTQLDIDILATNEIVNITFQLGDPVVVLEVPSTVTLDIPANSLVELKDAQGVVITTFDAGDPSIDYLKEGTSPFLIEVSVCGNSKVEPGEECDDGNNNGNDNCSNTCEIIAPICGDGVVEGDEECDDPNDANCSDTCLILDNDGCSLNVSNSRSNPALFLGLASMVLGGAFVARRRSAS